MTFREWLDTKGPFFMRGRLANNYPVEVERLESVWDASRAEYQKEQAESEVMLNAYRERDTRHFVENEELKTRLALAEQRAEAAEARVEKMKNDITSFRVRTDVAEQDLATARREALEEAKNWPEVLFVRHIENHLRGSGGEMPRCKICGEGILDIEAAAIRSLKEAEHG